MKKNFSVMHRIQVLTASLEKSKIWWSPVTGHVQIKPRAKLSPNQHKAVLTLKKELLRLYAGNKGEKQVRMIGLDEPIDFISVVIYYIAMDRLERLWLGTKGTLNWRKWWVHEEGDEDGLRGVKILAKLEKPGSDQKLMPDFSFPDESISWDWFWEFNTLSSVLRCEGIHWSVVDDYMFVEETARLTPELIKKIRWLEEEATNLAQKDEEEIPVPEALSHDEGGAAELLEFAVKRLRDIEEAWLGGDGKAWNERWSPEHVALVKKKNPFPLSHL